MEEPPPITIKKPSNNKTNITGANQNFFRSFINSHKSLSKSIVSLFNQLNINLFQIQFSQPILVDLASQKHTHLSPNNPFPCS